MKSSLSLFLVAFLIGAATLLVIADFSGGIFGFVPDWRWASLIALLAIAIWLAPTLGAYRGHAGQALTYVAIWLAVSVVIAVIYVYRDALGYVYRDALGLPLG